MVAVFMIDSVTCSVDRERGIEHLLLTSNIMRVDVQHHLVVRSKISLRGEGNEQNGDCRGLNSSC